MADWTFITNHGLIMAQIAKNPESTTREIARAVNVTERTTLKIIANLEAEGYIERRRVGRRNVYHIDPCLRLRHETASHVEVGDLLRVLGWKKPKTQQGQ